jgi:hypothetical protein
VDNRAEVREFLISRRAKITPEQAGVPQVGHRRVPGLRRSEAGRAHHREFNELDSAIFNFGES